jgi:hypothetical protein
MMMMKNSADLISQRIGAIGKNRYGSIMKVVEYNAGDDIWVKFGQGKPVHTSWQNFCKGTVRNVYDKSVHGIGYIGEGTYKVRVNGKIYHSYAVWKNMIERCYKEKFIKKYPTYRECLVCDEWHNYQNFARWFDENYYEVEKEKMELDKDILVNSNKLYSSKTCIFVPKRINQLFSGLETKKGDLPSGVMFHKRDNKYYAQCMNADGDQKFLGYFRTAEDAYKVYKSFKENVIKKVAEEYRHKIPPRLYEAMINYEL